MTHHRDTETQRDPLSETVLGAAIEVHRNLGPGLLESAYEECLCYELAAREVGVRRQVELPVIYKTVKLDCGYRMDVVVSDALVVEVKAVEKLLPVHQAQLLTYLKLSGLHTGLLINFNVPVLKQGIRRMRL
jgi:GxxExxY protein